MRSLRSRAAALVRITTALIRIITALVRIDRQNAFSEDSSCTHSNRSCTDRLIGNDERCHCVHKSFERRILCPQNVCAECLLATH
jgi:hypothetical protein